MNIHNLKVIASCNSRLLLRSWLFRLFFFFLLCFMFFYQAIEQSSLFREGETGLITLSSFIPYANAYMFTILMTIPLIFLAGTFLVKKGNMDSMDTVYYRPESNAEYVWGMFWGFFRVFVYMAIVSLLLGLLLHLFASKAPLDIWLYLFYLVTLIVPALVFLLGLSFFIHVWVRNQGMAIFLLLGMVILLVFYSGNVRHGFLDPLGLSLPNVFSSVTGHPALGTYLLQRLCWLFIGLGFVELSVLCFKRLVNHPLNRTKVLGLAIGFMIVGILFGGTIYLQQVKRDGTREKYVDVYNKYAKVSKGSVVFNHIDFQQEGECIAVKSDLVIQNKTPKTLDEIIIYLNPALVVVAVKEKGEGVSFDREAQVLRVKRPLEAGQSLELQIEYRGKIDQEVCYLDVPDAVLYDEGLNSYSQCRYGKKYVFLRDDYTLLIPECLWYPMTTPPVNPASSYDIPKDFTMYSLRVSGFGDREVVSQGERQEEGDDIFFHNTLPLHGISLCMGDFEKRGIVVDSTRYELYVFKGHESLLGGLEAVQDTLPALIRDHRFVMEYSAGRNYPYPYLLLAETPISFAGFYRNNRGGSEFVQPGMVFLPERGIGVWMDVEAWKNYKHYPKEYRAHMLEASEADRCANVIKTCFYLLFENEEQIHGEYGLFTSIILNRLGTSEGIEWNKNLYNAYPLFLNYTFSFQSNPCPVMEVVLANIFGGAGSLLMEEDKVLEYLKTHSLEDAVNDRELAPSFVNQVLLMKADVLLKRLVVNGLTLTDAKTFLHEYLAKHCFQQIRFSDFDTCFSNRFGVSWSAVLSDWYTVDRLPVFWVKDLEIAIPGEEPREMTTEEFMKMLEKHAGEETVILPGLSGDRMHVRATIYNDSDVDGVVSIQFSSLSGWSSKETRREQLERDKVVTRNYLVKAKKGVEISLTSDDLVAVTKLDLNLASNLPNKIDRVMRLKEEVSYTRDTAQFTRELDRSYFLPAPGEIIVDNEDEGFYLDAPKEKSSFLRRFLNKEPKRKSVTFVVDANMGEKLVPACALRGSSYGLAIRSFVYMEEGGKARMEWRTPIEQAGEYDLYAYVPETLNIAHREKQKGGGLAIGMSVAIMETSVAVSNQPEVKQYYTLYNGGTEQEIVGTITNPKGYGWVYLGRFNLSAGECKMVLDDRGEPGQVLLGDAMKWVRVENK